MTAHSWVSDAESSSSSSVMNGVSIEKLAMDSSASRTNTLSNLGGQSSGVTAAGSSGNASITNKLETGRQGPHSPAIVKTTAGEILPSVCFPQFGNDLFLAI